MRTPLAVLLALAIVSGCGPANKNRKIVFGPGDVERSSTFASQFPPASELDALTPVPAPTAAPTDLADVESWTLAGPMPDRYEILPRASKGSPWDAIVDGALAHAGGKGRATESAACIARELSRFVGKNGRRDPVTDLMAFIAARCGADVGEVDAGFQSGEVSPAATDGAIAKQVSAVLEPQLAGWASKDEEIGLAVYRDKKRITMAMVSINRSTDVQPFPFVPDDEGTVRFQGRLRADAAHLVAFVGKGPLGFEACESEGLKLPAFAFTCHVSKDDPSAWIVVSGQTSEHALLYPVFSTIVFPAGKPVNAYRRPSLPSAPPDADPAGPDPLIATVNGVRVTAGLAPLKESKPESEVATKIAGHFFENRGNGLLARSDATDESDRLARGLVAGWSIGEPLRYGRFVSADFPTGADAPRLIASLLDRPDGRSSLLDPDATLAAAGRVATAKGELIAAVIATWAPAPHLFGQTARVALVSNAISRVRARVGKPPLTRDIGLDADVAEAADAVESRHIMPRRALDALLQAGAAHAKRDVHGWAIECESLDDLTLPPEIALADAARIAIGVAWAQAPGDPWGRWVVLIVKMDD